ncbi:MAG TPA: sensor domain-containing diguanylate cyclase [Geobacteraceae bacterium]|nr:sensor domain-containing diguanylate cyclase [Geobacteraceae bacterium]
MMRKYKKNESIDLLVDLKRHHLLGDFNLTLYRKHGADAVRKGAPFRQCSSIVQNPFSNKIVIPFLEKQIGEVLKTDKPIICRTHGGLLSFLIPFRVGSESLCLVGDGVRENSIDCLRLEEFCRRRKTDVSEVLEQIEKLPAKACDDVKDIAARIREGLLELEEENDYGLLIDKTRHRLNSIVRGFSQIDESKTAEDVVSFSGKILSTLFDSAKIAFGLRDETGKGFILKGTRGLPEELGSIPEDKLSLFIAPNAIKRTNKPEKEIRALLPALDAESLACFPLETHGVILGFVALCDTELDQMEDGLVELLANRITAKFIQLAKEREQMLVGSMSSSLMSLTHTLLFSENNEELYRSILEIGADLVGASRGSIMLVDKNGKNLHIGFCKGMNMHVARSITVKLGEGIAGRVASSGVPLLVDDIEKDSRVAMPNRPRFKTKSLLCVPLKLKDRSIGVLNMSDKENGGTFNESDLNLLASFANLASLMIERSWVLERSFMLERLSVTDHLTGLYNHRYLRNRLEEELNRSTRNELNLSIIFIDIDFFKIYNDFCGHLAGDAALKKTADILRAFVRDMDVVVRYGGEEFCIVLPDTSKEEAVVVAERIRQEIEKEKFPNEENLPHGRLTASIGIASFPEDGHTFTTLVHSADLALYRAKANGRNRVELGQPALHKDLAVTGNSDRLTPLPE